MIPFKIVIPARFASTRLPGKPLLDIGGRAMIVRVAEQAALAGATEVIVATDDERILRVVAAAGHQAAMTKPEHRSGSDRVCEVVGRMGWSEDAVIINLQGDEPLAPPAIIRQLAEAMVTNERVAMATLCEPVLNEGQIDDPNIVKVVRDEGDFALYFSRSPIPMARDGRPNTTAELAATWRRHIGIYGYRASALHRFVTMPPSPLEKVEGLEQLRALENGMRILALDACRSVPQGVDTPADLQRIRDLLNC